MRTRREALSLACGVSLALVALVDGLSVQAADSKKKLEPRSLSDIDTSSTINTKGAQTLRVEPTSPGRFRSTVPGASKTTKLKSLNSWQNNLTAILEELNNRTHDKKGFAVMSKFKSGGKSGAIDLLKEKLLQDYGALLNEGDYPQAFAKLTRFVEYLRRIDRRALQRLDLALSAQLVWCAKQKGQAKQECFQAILNPAILASDLLSWKSIFQKNVKRNRQTVLEAAALYPSGQFGLFCYDLANNSLNRYTTANSLAKTSGKTFRKSSKGGSKGSASSGKSKVGAMLAMATSLAYPQRLGSGECWCTQMAFSGFVCGGCDAGMPSEDFFASQMLAGSDQGASGTSGESGSKSGSSRLDSLSGSNVFSGCGMSFGGAGGGGGGMGGAPQRCGLSGASDMRSLQRVARGGANTLSECVQQARTAEAAAGPYGGVTDPSCQLMDDGGDTTARNPTQDEQDEINSAADAANRELERKKAEIQGACMASGNSTCSMDEINQALDNAHALGEAALPMDNLEENEGFQGGTITNEQGEPVGIIIDSDRVSDVNVQTEEQLHAALTELGVPIDDDAQDDTYLNNLIGTDYYEEDEQHRLISGITGGSSTPGPDSSGTDCSAAAQRAADLFDCMGLGGIPPTWGIDQVLGQNSPGALTNPDPDDPNTYAGSLPGGILSGCGGGLNDQPPWWVDIAGQYGVSPRSAGAVDPCAPGDDACGSSGGEGGPINAPGGVVDPPQDQQPSVCPAGQDFTCGPGCPSGQLCCCVAGPGAGGGGGSGPDPEGD